MAPITAIQARHRYAATVAVAPPQDPGGGEGPWTSAPSANHTVTSEIRKPKNGVCSTMDTVNHPPHYTSHPSGVECVDITEQD